MVKTIQTVPESSADRSMMKNTVHLSFGEEIGNAVSHGIMLFFLLFSLPFVSVHAYLRDGWIGTTSIGLYTLCMAFMFGGSCLYHIMPYDTPWKTVFRKLDHISILLAIAGTYTPICLVLLKGWLGWTLFGIEWGLALAGILLKGISSKSWPKLSLVLYLLMGWFVILVFPMVWNRCSPTFLSLVAAGGIFYTIGVYFYAKKKPYFHFIWHLFIIAAAICHWIAIVFFI